jgi:hypothetical protein
MSIVTTKMTTTAIQNFLSNGMTTSLREMSEQS